MLSSKNRRGSAAHPITRPQHTPAQVRIIAVMLCGILLILPLLYTLLPLTGPFGPVLSHLNADVVTARALDGETVELLEGPFQGQSVKRSPLYEGFENKAGQDLTVRTAVGPAGAVSYHEEGWFREAYGRSLLIVGVLGLLTLACGSLASWIFLREHLRRGRVLAENRRVKRSAWRLHTVTVRGFTFHTLQADFVGSDGLHYRVESGLYAQDPTGRFDPERLEIVLDPDVPALSQFATEHLPPQLPVL